MTELFCSVGGIGCTSVHVYAGQTGPWYTDAVLNDSVALTGQVTVQIGSLVLQGYVEPSYSDPNTEWRSLRVIGGRNGWGKRLKQKTYYDDAGVNPRLVAEDAARECGEILGSYDDGGQPKPQHYVRRNAAASLVLERLASGKQWWVDQTGVTHVGDRPTVTATVGTYQVDTYSPLHRLATISLDDPAALWVGSIITERVAEPQTIRDIEIHVEGTVCRVKAFTGGDDSDASRIGRCFDALFEQQASRRLYGKYRYTVHSLDGAKVNLQVVRRLTGLPDAPSVSIRPGTAGTWASVPEGAEVLVEFIEGDSEMPIVTGFPARGEPGYLPSKLQLAVPEGATGAPCARLGDVGVAYLEEAMVVGTMQLNGETVPFQAVATFTEPAPVTITTGSDAVDVGGA